MANLIRAAPRATSALLPPLHRLTTTRALSTEFSANLDFRRLGVDVAAAQREIDARCASGDAAEVWRLHGAVIDAKLRVDAVRTERNALSKLGKQGKLDAATIAAGRRLKVDLADAEATLRSAEAALDGVARQIPNTTHAATPVGDEDAAVVRYESPRAARDFPARDHLEICRELGLADFEGAARTTGSKFAFLRGAGVWLEMALTQWAMRRLAENHGFAPLACPDLVRSSIVEGCGFTPRDSAESSSQIYRVESSPLSLSATAEIALAGLHAETTHDAESLPLRLAGVSHCFRTEAGARGSEDRGLYRLHQFTKVEMFVVAPPEESETIFEELVAVQRSLYDELELPYRQLEMPTEELGASAHRKVDTEAWMPGRGGGDGAYGEICSTSNCTDFQSRRLRVRMKRRDAAKTEYPHLLNGTACAVPRVIVAILENGQRPDGSVDIPRALHPFMPDGMDRLEA